MDTLSTEVSGTLISSGQYDAFIGLLGHIDAGK